MASRILVIDDDPDSLKVIRKIFAAEEFEVRKCRSGGEALKILTRFVPDIIILDVILDDTTGTDLLVKIREDEKFQNVLFILISGMKISSEDYLFGLEIGAADYIRKPLKQKEFLAKIKSLLDLRNSFAKSREQKKVLFNQDNTDQTAEIFGEGRLSVIYPEEFDKVCDRYLKIFTLAVERRIYSEDVETGLEIKELSAELGYLRCSARDVVEIHKSTLQKLTQEQSAKRAFYIKEEGRILLLELMGYLMNYYRSLI